MGNGETCPMSPVYLHLPGEAFSSVALGPLASEPLGWSLVKDSDSLWGENQESVVVVVVLSMCYGFNCIFQNDTSQP